MAERRDYQSDERQSGSRTTLPPTALRQRRSSQQTRGKLHEQPERPRRFVSRHRFGDMEGAARVSRREFGTDIYLPHRAITYIAQRRSPSATPADAVELPDPRPNPEKGLAKKQQE